MDCERVRLTSITSPESRRRMRTTKSGAPDFWPSTVISGDRGGRAGHIAGLLFSLCRLPRVGDQKLLRGIHLHPQQRPRKMQKRLQVQRRVALLEAVPVAQQEVAILEHPQVAHAVVDRPQSLGRNRSSRQRQHHGANLALVAPFRPRPRGA
jgi:hypothetical protein